MSVSTYPIKKALLSVSDKTGLGELATALLARGVALYSTGGTADFLEQKCHAPVTRVENVTQFPEMMDGRVKTLHPKIFGGVLARRGAPEDLASATEHAIPLFDLVVVNLYPFWEHLGKDADTQSKFIDIGGPSLQRAAAKNSISVVVLSDPRDYSAFLTEFAAQGGGTTLAFRRKMAAQTFKRTSEYDALIAAEWEEETRFPNLVLLSSRVGLRYGENPHQEAAWVKTAAAEWSVLQGKELSYNNLLDAEAAYKIAFEFSKPACAIVKHNNPCGVASGEGQSLSAIFERAFSADSASAFGGIVAFNRPVDTDTAHKLSPIFFEVILAPSFYEGAREVLAAKKNLRLIEWPNPQSHAFEIRGAMGGWLLQSTDDQGMPDVLDSVTDKMIPPDLAGDLEFAWLVCKHVKSNAIVIAKDGMTLGIGAGQMSRVDAVRNALSKAREKGCAGAVLASDAFFPFRDNIDLLKDSGIRAIIQPGGSVRDAEVIAACNELGIAMALTKTRHFRH